MRIGTRGSALALAQAESVARRLGGDAEIVTITTSGDHGAVRGDKSRWVRSSSGRSSRTGSTSRCTPPRTCPRELAEGLELVAFPERADPRDVICGAASLASLAPGARVGTSSLRRAPRSARRGTTSRSRPCAGTSTRACASSPRASTTRSCSRSPASSGWAVPPRPAGSSTSWCRRPGRARSRRGPAGGARRGGARPLSDPDASACVPAERELVRALGASCNTPVGAYAHTRRRPRRIRAWSVCRTARPGRRRARGRRRRDSARVAERLLAAGAARAAAPRRARWGRRDRLPGRRRAGRPGL